jgi:hypothetical protein
MNEASPLRRIGFPSLLWKALVIGVSGALVLTAALSAIANAGRSAAPQKIMQLWPWDALAPALVGGELLSPDLASASSRRIAQLARLSLTHQVLNQRALRLLGLYEDARGRAVRARTLFLLAEHLSRRDPTTELWLIEDSVRHNDSQAALKHYDHLLRAHPDRQTILFPILSGALADSDLRKAITPYVRANTPWVYDFLNYSIANSDRLGDVVALLREAGGFPPDAPFRGMEARLIANLAGQKDFALLRQYYLSLPGVRAGLLEDPSISRASSDMRFVPLTWQLSTTPAIGASLENAEGKSVQIRIFANSGERGVALHRLIYLPPGHYDLRDERVWTRKGDRSEAYWTLACADGETSGTIWRSDEVTPGFIIPATCHVQDIQLLIAGGFAQEGAELLIKSLSLHRRSGPTQPAGRRQKTMSPPPILQALNAHES